MGVYRITLTPSTNDLLLYAFDDTSCGETECVGWINEGGAGVAETFDVHLVASQVLFIVADAASGVTDTFTLGVQRAELGVGPAQHANFIGINSKILGCNDLKPAILPLKRGA